MPATVRQSKGFTLIEVMVAMVIMMIGLLGLLHVVTATMDSNLANVLREEAVKIAEQRMNGVLRDTGGTEHEGLKNSRFDSLVAGAENPFVVEKDFRSLRVQYTVQGSIGAIVGDTRSLQVQIQWTYRGQNYSHTIGSVVAR